MVIIPDEDPEKKVEDPEKKDGELKPEEGLDARFNERFQKRMETLKRAVRRCARDVASYCIRQRVYSFSSRLQCIHTLSFAMRFASIVLLALLYSI